MNPKEALQILDRISAMVQMNRTDHARAQEAVKVLSGLVEYVNNMNTAKKEKDPLPKDFLKDLSKDIKKVD